MAVSHRNLPDSELHNPKGFSNALGKEILYKDTDNATEPSWGPIDSSLIPDDAVVTSAIEDSAVTNDKVADGELGSEKFQSGDEERSWVNQFTGLEVEAGSINIAVGLADYSTENASSSYPTYTYGATGSGQASVIVFGSGTVTCGFYLGTDDSGRGAQGRILKNGSQVYEVANDVKATLLTGGYTGGVGYSFDLDIAPGDVITFQCKDDGGLSNTGILFDMTVGANKIVPAYTVGSGW